LRKDFIAIVFLTLVSIPIGMAFAEPDIIVGIKSIDPSKVPSADGVAPMAVGVASTYNIYPSTQSLNVYYTVIDRWFGVEDIAILVPQATGHYDLWIYVFMTNPSNKWACGVLQPNVDPFPSDMATTNKVVRELAYPTSDYLAITASNITWNSQNKFVWGVHIVADVVSTGGNFKVRSVINQLRTDLNSDRVVNIIDLSTVARQYGKVFQQNEPINQPYNILMDPFVNLLDIIAIAVEFGRQIPP